MKLLGVSAATTVSTFLCLYFPLGCSSVKVIPRHCRGSPKHIHIAVGNDPSTQMTISFATRYSYPDVPAPIGGVHVGRSPDKLDRYVEEQEFPISYNSTNPHGQVYFSPYQHHITVDGLKPNTKYYYVVVAGSRESGSAALRGTPLRDHPSQHVHENLEAENKILSEEQMNEEEEDNGRRLAPPPYNGSEKPCVEAHRVRSFTTAPEPSPDVPVTFAIIGDLGQFDHSRETLESMKEHDFDATVLVGDVAYTGFDHRRWCTFFDFLDDYSPFDESPLMIATGNHDIDKQENYAEIFQAYETRFRMPQVHPAELGLYDGPLGLLNMDAPPYPLPYEWGNAYYSFTYGPAKHVIVSAYSSMDPGSKQYNFLVDELSTLDRTETPWLLVSIHVPIYNTFSLHKHDKQIVAAREHLEPMFMKYNVNMVFTGHIHAYQRTANVYQEKLHPKGPIHITIGAGGRDCQAPFKTEEPEDWIISRDATYYGYGLFSIHNRTHSEWKWIPLSPSDTHDYNMVAKQPDTQLPVLQHDSVVVENQIFR